MLKMMQAMRQKVQCLLMWEMLNNAVLTPIALRFALPASALLEIPHARHALHTNVFWVNV
jgi:hypothetical protein